MAMTLPNVAAIGRRKKLQTLYLKSCSIADLSGLADADGVRFLQLWRATNTDIDVVGDMRGLQSLYLQTVNNIATFAQLPRARKLGRVILYAVQRMRDFRALASVKSLREFACFEMKDQQLEDFLPILGNRNVEAVTLHSTKVAVHNAAKALTAKHGKNVRHVGFMRDDFAYVD